MGLFSGILSAVAGPLVGNMLGRSNARYSQSLADASDGSKLQRMVADAKKAGINTYAALMGGAGASGAGPGPRVVSETAWSGSFDRIEELITGSQAAADRQKAFNKDLERVAIDTLGRGALPSNLTNRGPSLSANSSELPMTPVGRTPDAGDLAPIEPPSDRPDGRYNYPSLTETGNILRPTFPDPRLADMQAVEERRGEMPELWSVFTHPWRAVQDNAYSRQIEVFAEERGITPRAAHEMMVENPQRTEELPGLGSAIIHQQFGDIRLPRIGANMFPVTSPRYTPRVP